MPKENQAKKKADLLDALKAMRKHQKMRAEAAKKSKARALKNMKARKKRDQENETKLNRQRFIDNYVRKAKADVMSMKIVNPLAGAVKKANLEVKASRSQHEKDVKATSKAAYAAAHVAAGNTGGQKAHRGKKTGGNENGQRVADLKLTQQTTLAHMSKMEAIDAESVLNKQRRLFTSLQSKLKRHREKLAKKAIQKAKLKAPMVWNDTVKKIKAEVKAGKRPHPTAPKKKKPTKAPKGKLTAAAKPSPKPAPKPAKKVAAKKAAKKKVAKKAPSAPKPAPKKMTVSKQPTSPKKKKVVMKKATTLEAKLQQQKQLVKTAAKKQLKPSSTSTKSKYKARKTTNKAKASISKTSGVIAKAMRSVARAKEGVKKAGVHLKLPK